LYSQGISQGTALSLTSRMAMGQRPHEPGHVEDGARRYVKQEYADLPGVMP
jgi:hypothetical protein